MKYIFESQMKLLLKIKGFKEEEGFCMDYDKPEESTMLSVFISKDEWIKKTLEGIKTYYWNDKTERMMDFDEAWEWVEDDLYEEFNTESVDVFENECLRLIQEHLKGELTK